MQLLKIGSIFFKTIFVFFFFLSQFNITSLLRLRPWQRDYCRSWLSIPPIFLVMGGCARSLSFSLYNTSLKNIYIHIYMMMNTFSSAPATFLSRLHPLFTLFALWTDGGWCYYYTIQYCEFSLSTCHQMEELYGCVRGMLCDTCVKFYF